MNVVTVRAPGKMFISGEYSILFGHPALLLAVDKYIYVTVGDADGYEYREENKEPLRTYSYEEFLKRVRRRSIHVYAALKTIHEELDLRIKNIYIHTRSTIPFKGLGSSAATLVATIYALNKHLDLGLEKNDILTLSYRVKKAVEGGSPADIAASLYGGIVLVKQTGDVETAIEKIDSGFMDQFRIEAVYTGERVATKNVVKDIIRSVNKSEYRRRIIDLIGMITLNMKDLLELGDDHEQFLRLFRLNHHLLAALGVSTPRIDEIIREIEGRGGYAKISGAGFGDSLLAIWIDRDKESLEKPTDIASISIDKEGATEMTTPI